MEVSLASGGSALVNIAPGVKKEDASPLLCAAVVRIADWDYCAKKVHAK